MTKLRCCPFCGPGPEVELTEFGPQRSAQIYCHGCALMFPGNTKYRSSDLASSAWNARHTDRPIEALAASVKTAQNKYLEQSGDWYDTDLDEKLEITTNEVSK